MIKVLGSRSILLGVSLIQEDTVFAETPWSMSQPQKWQEASEVTEGKYSRMRWGR